MAKRFVTKSITIHASAQKVWDVLTDPYYTKRWVSHFSPQFRKLESDWQAGNPVYWKLDKDEVHADGIVTHASPPHKLSFSVRDARGTFDGVHSEEDGIVYSLVEEDGHTTLIINQGDFGKVPGGEKLYQATAESWDNTVPIIKQLAEASHPRVLSF